MRSEHDRQRLRCHAQHRCNRDRNSDHESMQLRVDRKERQKLFSSKTIDTKKREIVRERSSKKEKRREEVEPERESVVVVVERAVSTKKKNSKCHRIASYTHQPTTMSACRRSVSS
ncbi:hypothetical protein EX30DRAFT_130538 [Ascodesmis nigricans]|uniref:Uncharacterized protein n=1 Tax=Ascodesmis nigricans TaxID=341454 RepID=A0A4V3SI50_9PEZI|nr:hypothetical protein EX30DRAFT_130538 [Ascodesmis nigricans]